MPKIVDHDRYRQELVERSVDLFARHGFGTLTTRGICKELGISTGTLYHYFPSKEALFKAVANLITRQDVEMVENMVPLSGDPMDLARAYLMYVQAFEDRLLSYSMVLAEYLRSRPADEVATDEAGQQTAQRYLDAIARVLGLVSRQAAAAVLSYAGGLVSSRHLFGGQPSFESQLPYLAAIIERGRQR